MMGRAERIGDRLVAGVITAAFIRGIAELASCDNERFGRWERPLMGIALGMSTALGGYLGWTARRHGTSSATLSFHICSGSRERAIPRSEPDAAISGA